MNISVSTTPLPDVLVVEPERFQDERGFFIEAYRRDVHEAAGLPVDHVQLNHSGSVRGVLRGLHFQWDPPMGKLMRVLRGTAFLVAVDIRHGSPTLGQWFGREVSSESGEQIWAPAGIARGFCALSDFCEIEYLCTGVYNGGGESGIAWDDPEVGIDWPVSDPIVSDKDRQAQSFAAWMSQPESNHFRFNESDSSPTS